MKDRIKQIFLCVGLLIGALSASAIEVTASQSGSLSGLISSPQSEKTLVVHGAIDASDLMFIAANMPAIVTLDLSDATIETCKIDAGGRTIVYPAGLIPSDIFARTTIKSFIFPRKCKIKIADMAFIGSALVDITLGDNVTKVGIGAFCANDSLRQVECTGATDLGSYAFRDCKSLKHAILKDMDSIGQSVFAGCVNLSDIEGSQALTDISESAFAGCKGLTEFVFGERLLTIGEGAFSSSALVSADLSSCTALKRLGSWAFSNCSSLKSVTLPEGLASIGEGAFFDCTALSDLTLPESTEEFADYSLKGVSEVSELNLPSATSHIGNLAMSGMSSLKSINARSTKCVPLLGDDVWDGLATNLIVLHVSRDMAADYRSAAQWQDFDIVMTSGEDDDITDRSKAISATIEGSNLLVRAVSDIRELHIYDITARRIYSDLSPDSNEVTVDISRFADRVLIVCASTADGIRAAVKIVRN